jgi:hypothetical protein
LDREIRQVKGAMDENNDIKRQQKENIELTGQKINKEKL